MTDFQHFTLEELSGVMVIRLTDCAAFRDAADQRS